MTPEEWDVHWHQVYMDLVKTNVPGDTARSVADRETADQFGPRPTKETS